MMEKLPLRVGAALTLAGAVRHADWLRDGDRDLELQDFWGAGPPPGDWRETARSARRLLAGWDGRLGIHGAYQGLDLATPDPDARAAVRRRLDERLDVCAELGAQWMVAHSPVTVWEHHHRGLFDPARRIEAVAAALGPALARAEALGVAIVLENIEDVDPGDRRAIVEAIGSPALRLSVDTGHALYVHGRFGAPPPEGFIAAAGALLGHVHLHDADGLADRHWAPGDGAVDWPAVFAAIAACGARPALVLELADPEDRPRGFAWLAERGLAC
jgi:sugar phosphate isomerase/epimerase